MEPARVIRETVAAVRRPGITRAFAASFLAILAVTALASTLSVGAVFYLLGQQGQDIPNTSAQVAAIERYAESNAGALLAGDAAARAELESRAADAPGVDYALLDARGWPLAASSPDLDQPYAVESLTRLQDVSQMRGGGLEESVALIRGGKVGGYLLVQYPTHNAAISTSRRLVLGGLLALAALLPVFFLAVSTLAFAALMRRRLGRPIGELQNAVEKVRERDLNFEIRYDEPDELGGLCRSFTELRDELRGSLEREWRQRQELEETVASLSHDLRNPATVIQGHIQSLQRTAEDRRAERLQRYLPVLGAASRRMSLLLDAILVAVNLRDDASLEGQREVRLSEELARKTQTYELLAGERGVTFSQKTAFPAEGDGETVNLDLEVFERVLDNLFENALRFTPAEGEITVEVFHDGREIEVAVRDSGPGVAPEDLERIFEKGYRGDRNEARGGISSGLGLYISRRLLVQRGGWISLSNRGKGGCEARFTLPAMSSRSSAVRGADSSAYDSTGRVEQ